MLKVFERYSKTLVSIVFFFFFFYSKGRFHVEMRMSLDLGVFGGFGPASDASDVLDV